MPELSPAAPPPVRRREIFGWAMFDFANSSYTTVIVTVAYSVYFTTLVAPASRADSLWGLGVMLSNLLVMLTSPFIGAVADDSGRKKLFLAGSWIACVVGTAGLWFVLPGAVALGLTLFVVSNVAYSFGENLAAAFLPEISTPQNIGKVSGFGWGLGYFGGLACLLVVRPLLHGGWTADNVPHFRLAWLATALFFLLAALPTFLLLRERAPRGPRRSVLGYAAVGVRRLVATARSARHFSELVTFLALFFVYSCGLTTVIAYFGIFAVKTVGFTVDELILLSVIVQISSAAGAFVFGFIQDRLGARPTIQVTLLLWILVCVAAYLGHGKGLFWAVALVAGLGIGSLQSASRGMVGLFSPLEKSGELFALWGLAGKGAFIVGPPVFGLISSVSGSQRLAMLSTAAFFVVGFVGMFFIREARGRAAALAWIDPAVAAGERLEASS